MDVFQFCRIKQADVQIKVSFVSMLVKLYLKQENLKVVTGFLVL